VKLRRSSKSSHSSPRPAGASLVAGHGTLREEEFLRVIGHERKRAERSGKPSLLMLIESEPQFSFEKNEKALRTILSALAATTRETDITGWYKNDCVIGVMFTEITLEDGESIVTTVMTRVSEALRRQLSSRQFDQANISFHLLPEQHEQQIPALPGHPTLYGERTARDGAERLVQR
jgi:hypothetical protein